MQITKSMQSRHAWLFLLCSLVSSTIAIPVVVFGAVSVIQQVQQANEDKALRLKAINTHNTFMSHEEEATQEAVPVNPAASLVLNSSNASGPSARTSQSSTNEPDAAAPAMLDQPDRPEPSTLRSPRNKGTDQKSDEQSTSQVPPQTAVLDRPDRPEPTSDAPKSSGSTHSDITAQESQPHFSSVTADVQPPTRPHSPRTAAQVGSMSCLHLSGPHYTASIYTFFDWF